MIICPMSLPHSTIQLAGLLDGGEFVPFDDFDSFRICGSVHENPQHSWHYRDGSDG